MAALDALRNEHARILQAIDRLEAHARNADDGRLPIAYLREVLDCIHVYVEENHHGKEERILFARMASDPLLAGIAGAFVEEHDEGRHLVAAIESAVTHERPVARHVDAYATFIRDHIRRENDMLFETIESGLDARTLAEIEAALAEAESESAIIDRV